MVLMPWMGQVVLPMAIIVLIALGPERARTHWWLQALFSALLLAVLGSVALWLAIPFWILWVEALLFAFALALPALRGRVVAGRPRGAGSLVLFGIEAVAITVLALSLVRALQGRQPPAGPEGRMEVMQLAFPLAEGTYRVASGGSTQMVNAHLRTLEPDPRFDDWRGQSHAVDLVAVGTWGSRVGGLAPGRPEQFAIFGARVSAPCDGRVVRVENGMPDLPIGAPDLVARAGNHVILECDGRWVVLAHLRHGTVSVEIGDEVRVGTPLGEVGNSGASDEPHLHIHAQTPGTRDAPLSGRPIPIRLDGRFLVRNQTVRR